MVLTAASACIFVDGFVMRTVALQPVLPTDAVEARMAQLQARKVRLGRVLGKAGLGLC
jgi:hypothetical protein